MLSAVQAEHIVNFDAPPLIPPGSGWEVRPKDQIASRLKGKWALNQSGLFLHLSDQQQQESLPLGRDVFKELREKKVVGVQLLDFYLENRDLIPREWKGKEVYFWGTIYRDREGHRFVRHLCKDGNTWWWSYDWLGFRWKPKKLALLAR